MFRAILTVLAAILAGVAIANVAIWHAAFWVPIGWYAAIVVLGLVFEAGRYRARVDRDAAWVDTGERFIDPTTRTETAVYYDPASGKREYRPIDASNG